MPREGVPYPERMLCSLKCELKNIWNALNGKLHSVNGVEGDGQGNVNIVSRDAAVVVTPQPLSNQVEISLDQSQLPAAAVSSVNGETGAVVLDASEIPYNDPDGYTDDVDEKLNVLTGVQNALQLSINQERTRAQNAESGLQNNINAEALTRGSDDAALQSQINALPTFSDVQDALDNYAPMMRLSDSQQYTGLKQMVKTRTNLPALIKMSDYDGSVSQDAVQMYGITGSDNNWIETSKIGTDNGGARAFYERTITLSLNNTKYSIRMRWNITSSGLQLQFFDPINNAWKNVVLS